MEVQHSYEKVLMGSKAEETLGFLLTNRLGSFLYLTTAPFSTYNGFFVLEGNSCFKSLDSIRQQQSVIKVINRFHSVERVYENGDSETFYYPRLQKGFLYEKKGSTPVVLTFDCKKCYDSRKWGKYYTMYEKDGCIVVEFRKNKNPAEDLQLEELEYTLYTVIKADSASFTPWSNWTKKLTPYDDRRGEIKEEYVFEALSFTPKRAAMVTGTDLTAAMEEAKTLFNEFDRLKQKEESYYKTALASHTVSNKEIELAYRCSLASLDMLTCTAYGTEGMFAGLPWLNQFWARDEGISAKALILAGRYEETKKILMKNIQNIMEDGRILNRTPQSDLGSADAAGWIFKRFDDLIVLLQQKGKTELLSEEELLFIQRQLLLSISRVEKKYATKEGMIKNSPKETWMDTTWNNEDQRDGIRIEMQALHLAMYRLSRRICSLLKDRRGEQKAAAKEVALVRQVRKNLWNKRILADGFYDFTIRPNAFMALYIYPDILTLNQKRSFAKNAVEKLWLDWGGFSTIQKDHPLYTDEYTGINNKSYHRGDSWFYLNNMIAVLLFNIDRTRYIETVKKVLAASTHEILYKGIVGHHAELSSAKRLESAGCHCQAWSAALYIELVNEMFIDV